MKPFKLNTCRKHISCQHTAWMKASAKQSLSENRWSVQTGENACLSTFGAACEKQGLRPIPRIRGVACKGGKLGGNAEFSVPHGMHMVRELYSPDRRSIDSIRRKKHADIRFVRANPEIVKENIRKKYQDDKLVLVDEVIALDEELRAAKTRGDELRANRNTLSREIGGLMKDGKKDEAEEVKKKVTEMADELAALEAREAELNKEVLDRMMVIPQIMDETVPLGRDDSENVELERYGDPSFPTGKCRITSTSWSRSTASIWRVPARRAATDSII